MPSRPAGLPAGAKPKLYNPCHPERTLLYQTIAEHFETWHALASTGQFDGQGDHHTPKPYVRQAFRKYRECGSIWQGTEGKVARGHKFYLRPNATAQSD